MRCVRHYTRPLNAGKLAQLRALVHAFNVERAYWVDELKPLCKLAQLDGAGVRRLRDERIKAGYMSPHGLQARGWKLALTEAADLLSRHWQAQLVAVKGVGLRDIILPGDMKSLLNQVIAAQKEAEANLIKRREETAAARSQANTAKLLAENPLLQRLKELELLKDVLADTHATFVLGQGDLSEQLRGLVAQNAVTKST